MTKHQPPESVSRPESDRMRHKKQAKRAAILEAALREFTDNGFADARLSAVARNAGVAKGTLYLYFDSKEKLFEGVVRETLLPSGEEGIISDNPHHLSTEAFRRSMLASVADLQNSGRSGIALVVLTEGRQFPQLVEIYVNAVLEPVLAQIDRLAHSDDTARLDVLRRFPQLLIAPVIAGLLWNRFMTGYPPIDLVDIASAQLALVLGDEAASNTAESNEIMD